MMRYAQRPASVSLARTVERVHALPVPICEACNCADTIPQRGATGIFRSREKRLPGKAMAWR